MPRDYTKQLTDEQIAKGDHRGVVGGQWDAIGNMQFEFLYRKGLAKEACLLDVGCGSLRGGRHFIDFLAPGHYYGIDLNKSLLDAGYGQELTDEQRAKLPRKNLSATDRFVVDFDVTFDAALAQSVFTHVSLNHVRLCLHQVSKVMKPGGRFYATFFEAPSDLPIDGVIDTKRHGRYTERDQYWYWPTDLEWAASFSRWRFHYIGDWGHPRDQRMVEFTRI